MRIKKIKRLLPIMSIVAATMSASLTGCGIVKKEPVDEKELIYTATNDSNKLYSGHYYIWHNDKQPNIEKDINTDVSKFKDYQYKIFSPVYMDANNFSKATMPEESLRVSWMLDENDDKIPTFYKGDELIFYSDTEVPRKYEIERFYDHGYTIGIYGLSEYVKGSNNYVFNTEGLCGIKRGSDAERLGTLLENNSIISVVNVGEKNISSEDISAAGTIKGLLKGSKYNVKVYVGTNRYVTDLTANVRVFSSMENYTAETYSFVGDGIIKIQLPDYLKTGYYCINEVGFFRYVDGTSYDENTDFNDPAVIKDDDNKIIYDPRVKTEDLNNSEQSNDDPINSAQNWGNESSGELKVNGTEFDSNSCVLQTILKSTVNNAQLDITFSQTDSEFYTNNPISIKYYRKSLETFRGSKYSPYTLILSDEELSSGKYSCTIEDLPADTWTFEIVNLKAYDKWDAAVSAVDIK